MLTRFYTSMSVRTYQEGERSFSLPYVDLETLGAFDWARGDAIMPLLTFSLHVSIDLCCRTCTHAEHSDDSSSSPYTPSEDGRGDYQRHIELSDEDAPVLERKKPVPEKKAGVKSLKKKGSSSKDDKAVIHLENSDDEDLENSGHEDDDEEVGEEEVQNTTAREWKAHCQVMAKVRCVPRQTPSKHVSLLCATDSLRKSCRKQRSC